MEQLSCGGRHRAPGRWTRQSHHVPRAQRTEIVSRKYRKKGSIEKKLQGTSSIVKDVSSICLVGFTTSALFSLYLFTFVSYCSEFTMTRYETCELCNQTMDSISEIQFHLISRIHLDREAQIGFKLDDK